MEKYDFFEQLGTKNNYWRQVGNDVLNHREDIRPYALKIEISALSLEDAYEIYDTIAPILNEYEGKIAYKFPSSKEQFLQNLDNIEKGNLFIIYTKNDADTIEIAKKLDKALMTIKNKVTDYTNLTSLEIGDSGNLAIVMDRDVKGKYLARTSNQYDIGRDIHPDIFDKLQKILEANNLLTANSRERNQKKLETLFHKEKDILTKDILEDLIKTKDKIISISYIFENYEVPKELFNKALLLGVKHNVFRIESDFVYLEYKGYKKKDYIEFAKQEEEGIYALCDSLEYLEDILTIEEIKYLFKGKEEEFKFELLECIEKSLKKLPNQERKFLENTSLEFFNNYFVDVNNNILIPIKNYENIDSFLKFADKNPRILLNIPHNFLDNNVKEAIVESFCSHKKGVDFDKKRLLKNFSRDTLKTIVSTLRYNDILNISQTYEQLQQNIL